MKKGDANYWGQILSAYCDPSVTLDFPTPTEPASSLTDFPEITFLAPCAQSALGYALRTMVRGYPTKYLVSPS
jgi:hypothetical protein